MRSIQGNACKNRHINIILIVHIIMPTKRRKELHPRAKKIVYLNIVLKSSGDEASGSSTTSVEISNENVVKGSLEIESKADILIHGTQSRYSALMQPLQ